MQEHATEFVYEEYQLHDSTVAMISDATNEYAWIQSDTTIPLTQ